MTPQNTERNTYSLWEHLPTSDNKTRISAMPKGPHKSKNHQLRFLYSTSDPIEIEINHFGRTMTPYIHKFTCDSDDCKRLSLP